MGNPFEKLQSQLSEIQQDLNDVKNLVSKEKQVDKILDVPETAKLLGLKSDITIYRKVKEGSIPHMKVGRKLLFSRNTLFAWLKETSNF